MHKVPFNSESEHDDAVELVRKVADDVGAKDIVPPPPGATNAPVAPQPAVEPPGPVAEPVPAQEQVPPPTSPEVAGAAPEEANAFSQTTPPAAPGAPA